MVAIRISEEADDECTTPERSSLRRLARRIQLLTLSKGKAVLVLAILSLFAFLLLLVHPSAGRFPRHHHVKRWSSWFQNRACGRSGAQTRGAVCVDDDVWNGILAEDKRSWGMIAAGVRHVDGKIVRDGYNRSYENDDRWGRKRADYSLSVWRPTLSCPREARVGAAGDGAKWTCGIDNLARKAKARGDCLVYSLGSNNNFDFEKDLLDRLDDNCEVHVFDHTVQVWRTPKSTQRIFTHSFALTSEEQAKAKGSPFKSYQEIRRILGHEKRYIDIFKIDIEGSEYEVLPEVLKDTAHPVGQILVEIHFSAAAIRSIGASDDLLYHFRNASYHMFHTEPNPYCARCFEYSFIHVER
jgi:hypothetical protein